MRDVQISVIGAGQATEEQKRIAHELGAAIAHRRWVLVSGGMGGVMEAAAKGAIEAGGTTIGILPTYSKNDGNIHNSVTIPTGMGHARNVIVAASGDAVISVGGTYGTLSEIAIALKLGKPVAAFDVPSDIEGIYRPKDVDDAIRFVKERLHI